MAVFDSPVIAAGPAQGPTKAPVSSPASEQSVPVGTDRAQWLAQAATQALLAEVDLTPKPGLVDRRGSGAHCDMNHALMQRSAHALTPGFMAMADAVYAHRPGLASDVSSWSTTAMGVRAALGAVGRQAEAAMMQATAGINTHRGAIWAMGLIVASAAAQPLSRWRAPALLAGVAALAAIDDPALGLIACKQPDAENSPSNGQRMVARFQVAGARREAMNGFVQIVDQGLPQLQASRAAGASETQARLDALLAIMAVLDDTCLLNRAGRYGLTLAQAGARRVLDRGGTAHTAGWAALATLDHDMQAINASPGGSADLLAATLLIDHLQAQATSGHTRDTERRRAGRAGHRLLTIYPAPQAHSWERTDADAIA